MARDYEEMAESVINGKIPPINLFWQIDRDLLALSPGMPASRIDRLVHCLGAIPAYYDGIDHIDIEADVEDLASI
jgi:hypothetical protein